MFLICPSTFIVIQLKHILHNLARRCFKVQGALGALTMQAWVLVVCNRSKMGQIIPESIKVYIKDKPCSF